MPPVNDAEPSARIWRAPSGLFRIHLLQSVRWRLPPPMPWRISYRHPLRPDDGGIRFVPDQSEAAAEKLRLELRGYAVSEPILTEGLRLTAQTEEVLTDEAVLARSFVFRRL